MECLTAEALVEYLCGLPAPESRTGVAAHLQSCADCRRLADELAGGSIDGRATIPWPPPTVDEEELQPGAAVQRYVIRRRVGAGGMGVVYEAHDPLLDRKLALKVLRGEAWVATEEMRQRVLREAQALARLTHPNVVAVHDVGRVGDHLFIAMDFIDGSTLDEWLRTARRGWRDVLDVYLRAGGGLAAAHDVGLVHRDFKPHNILLGDGRVCVTDFGLARLGPRAPAHDEVSAMAVDAITRDGVVMGSPGYMAPEQMVGGEIDSACDVFSFAVSLFEALYGERPFRGKNLIELCAAIVTGQLPDAPAESLVPAWLRAAVVRGLACDPAARPTMRSLLDELERERAGHGLALAEKLLEEAGAMARATGGEAQIVKVAARLLRDFVEQGPYEERKEDETPRRGVPAAVAGKDPDDPERDEVALDAPILADVEIVGAHAQAILDKLGYQALASHFMLREGLGILLPDGTTGFDPRTWYPALPFVRAAHNLVREVGPRAGFHAGLFTREAAARAPVPDMRAGLAAIDRTYHRAFRLRGKPLVNERGEPLPGIGRYRCEERGPTEVVVTASGPWPCELDRGMIAAVALRIRPDAAIAHDDAEPCRKRGHGRCAYRVRWGASALAGPNRRLRPAGGVEDFLRDPIGRYVTGPTFLYWYADPHLDGAIFWGRPEVDELRSLIAVWDAIKDDRVTHSTIIDLRKVVEIPPDTFIVVQTLLGGRREEYGRRIRAMALLRSAAMPGALITGLFSMEGVLHPFEFFDDEATALAWLGRPDAELAAAVRALAAR